MTAPIESVNKRRRLSANSLFPKVFSHNDAIKRFCAAALTLRNNRHILINLRIYFRDHRSAKRWNASCWNMLNLSRQRNRKHSASPSSVFANSRACGQVIHYGALGPWPWCAVLYLGRSEI